MIVTSSTEKQLDTRQDEHIALRLGVSGRSRPILSLLSSYLPFTNASSSAYTLSPRAAMAVPILGRSILDSAWVLAWALGRMAHSPLGASLHQARQQLLPLCSLWRLLDASS